MAKVTLVVLLLAVVYQAQSIDQSNKCSGRSYWQPLVADDTDPHKFHVCKDGQDVGTQTCPIGTVFSEAGQICVHDQTVDPVCSGHWTGRVANQKDKHSFYVCQDGKAYAFQCPANLVFSDRYQVCVWPDQDN